MLTVLDNRTRPLVLFFLCLAPIPFSFGAGPSVRRSLQGLDSDVLHGVPRQALSGMLRSHVLRRIRQANDRSRLDWSGIKDRDSWEQFRNHKLDALRRSLGSFPQPSQHPRTQVTGIIRGEGFVIEKLLFSSRPGWWVTANLYTPRNGSPRRPAILIAHSHHRPKEQGELQDMGMTWARCGYVVLIIDQVGHGERRQHPFRSAADFGGEFRVNRQDYYFRYDVGIQLHLIGDSLMGWMAWDLMRAVDVLLARDEVDAQRIMLLGAVAGGGDVAAVTAALDQRIAAVGAFHFGGPQGFHPYPLPDDAETSFNYSGSGSWESTRNLRRSCADGFLPWVIVGSVAPRRLLYGQEFSWDQPRDPVWKRLQAIFGFYDAAERLGFAHGRGTNRQRPPLATHCTHIGREHRAMIHPLLQRWFNLAVTTADEYSRRLPEKDLRCLTPTLSPEFTSQPLHNLARNIAAARVKRARRRRVDRADLQQDLTDILGPVELTGRVDEERESTERDNCLVVHRVSLRVEQDIVVPLVLLVPAGRVAPPPVVVGIAQAGKARLLEQRAEFIAQLLEGGAAVCLPDLRGTGETRAGDDRGRRGAATRDSSSELMLGGTLIGAQFRDLRAVLVWLRSRTDVDTSRAAVWGDSLAKLNQHGTDRPVPRGVASRPHQVEPMGCLIALLAGLYEDQIAAIYIHRGLSGFGGALNSPFVQLPHDAVLPGLLARADLCDLAAALAPRPLCLRNTVDASNGDVPPATLRRDWAMVRSAYHRQAPADALVLDTMRSNSDVIAWLQGQLAN